MVVEISENEKKRLKNEKMSTDFERFWEIGENYNDWVMEKYHRILRNTAHEYIQDGSLITASEMMTVLSFPAPIRNIIEDQINKSKRYSSLNVDASQIVLPFFRIRK